MTSVALEVAQQQFDDIIRDVRLGGHVVIMEDNVPVAEIVPARNPHGTPCFGSAKGMIGFSNDFDSPLPDLEPYTR